MAVNWKVAAAGGAVLGLGIGGFSLANADGVDTAPVRDVDLQSARNSVHSASSPIQIPSTTTLADAQSPAAPPAPSSTASNQGSPAGGAPAADSPDPVPAPAPAPAPAPSYEDSASPVQPAPTGDADSGASVDDANDS